MKAGFAMGVGVVLGLLVGAVFVTALVFAGPGQGAAAAPVMSPQAVEDSQAAWRAYDAGRWDEAALGAEKALEDYPEHKGLRVLAARAHWMAGRDEVALAMTEAQPRPLGAPRSQTGALGLWRARILWSLDRPDEAQQTLDALLADDPDHLGALVLAGRMAQDQGRVAESLAWYDRAVARGSEVALALVERARIHQASGDLAAAREDLGRAGAWWPGEGAGRATLEALGRDLGLLEAAEPVEVMRP